MYYSIVYVTVVMLHYRNVIMLCFITITLLYYGTLNVRDYTGVIPGNMSFKAGINKGHEICMSNKEYTR